jgi:hypothetical protein
MVFSREKPGLIVKICSVTGAYSVWSPFEMIFFAETSGSSAEN